MALRGNDAIVERLERVIETLQDNSIKMGQMLAVHDEKLDKQDRIDAVLFEKVKVVKEIYAKLITVFAQWKRRCGLFLVLFLFYLSSLVQSDKESLDQHLNRHNQG